MTPYDASRLALLATLWSLQCIFLRVAVPAFGTALVAEGRALFAALFLVPWVLIAGQRIGPLEHWKDHLSIGLVNNVLPFACFAWAATALPAGYLAIINGTVPLWTAIFAASMLGEPLGGRRLAGFALGIAGAAFWGLAGVMIKQRSGRMPPMGLVAGSIAFAAILMAPFWTQAPGAAWTVEATAALVAVGALCSGLAYLPFFTLVRDIGPSRTLSVGFLVPVLGVLWGWLLLDEAVTLPMLVGATLVLLAMALVLKR